MRGPFGRAPRLGARVRQARLLAAAALLSLLGACTTPPPESAPAAPPSPPPLKPLARQAGTPADAPRSSVPPVNYDLFAGRGDDDLPPDDGPPAEVFQRGGASWYGMQFHQRKTASGERFDMGAMTAAHKTLPFGTRVCVRSLVNGKEVLVRINDRGPYAAGRVIDLSQAAAERLDMIGLGIKQVTLALIGAQGGRCNGTAVASADDAAPPEPELRADRAAPPRRPTARAKPRRSGKR